MNFSITMWKFVVLYPGFSSWNPEIVVSKIKDAAIISISYRMGEQMILCEASEFLSVFIPDSTNVNCWCPY